MNNKILIVEDELIVARDIRKTLERNGFKIAGVARTVEKALSIIEEAEPWLVLADIFLKGDLTGIDLAKRLNEKGIPFIYVSANSNQQVLEAAKTTDPYGFIVKPFREKDLLVTIDIARYRYENKMKMNSALPPAPAEEIKQPLKSIESVRQAPPKTRPLGNETTIGRSAPMLHVFNLIEQVAPFDTSVLILGESGTGKEGVAKSIVQLSGRRNKPFIKINCAAIPSELMEAELFGYEKGAFTGASDRRAGKFELANGGTILLDEIGEMALELQAKLLRILQEREFQRLGSNMLIKIDVRILAATSRILEKEVAEGRFRLDLYYRLNVFPISLPPLRDRKEDIALLVDYFLRFYSDKTGKKVTRVDDKVMQQLTHYNWPGNIRELQHRIERSVLLSRDETIKEIDLPAPTPATSAAGTKTSPVKTMEETERDHILTVLNQCHFKVTGPGGAAEILHIPASTLKARMKKLGIDIHYE